MNQSIIIFIFLFLAFFYGYTFYKWYKKKKKKNTQIKQIRKEEDSSIDEILPMDFIDKDELYKNTQKEVHEYTTKKDKNIEPKILTF